MTGHWPDCANYLRNCGRCGGSFLGDNRKEIYFCPKCTAVLPEFDPQPYSVCGGNLDKQRCRYEGHEHVVLAREGNAVTVRALNFPDAAVRVVDVHNLRPHYITPGY